MGCKASKEADVRNAGATKRTPSVVNPPAPVKAIAAPPSTFNSPLRSAALPFKADLPTAAAPVAGNHAAPVVDAASPLVEVLEVAEPPEAVNSPTSPVCCPALAARRRSRSLSTASEPDIFAICESSTIESMSRRWNRRRLVEEGRQEMASMLVNGAVFEAMIVRRCELEEEEESSHATTTSPASTTAAATMRSAAETGCCGGTDSGEAVVQAAGCGPAALISPRGLAPSLAGEDNRHAPDVADIVQPQYSAASPLLRVSAAASPFGSRAVNTASSPTATASTQKQASFVSSGTEECVNVVDRWIPSEEGMAVPTGWMGSSYSQSSSTMLTMIQVHEASLVVRPQHSRPLRASAEGSPIRGAAAHSKTEVVVTPAKQMRRADPNIVSVAQGALKRSAMHQANSATQSNSNASSRSTSVASYASRASAGTKTRCNPKPADPRLSAARRGTVACKRDRGCAALMQQEKYEQMCALFERTLTQPSTLDAQLNTR